MEWKPVETICKRCGHRITDYFDPLGTGTQCERCFPVYSQGSGPRAELVGTPQGILGRPITLWIERSPTIDVLDLDRSALRALEEIANG